MMAGLRTVLVDRFRGLFVSAFGKALNHAAVKTAFPLQPSNLRVEPLRAVPLALLGRFVIRIGIA